VVGDLIMLPVRVGVRATRLWLRVAEETVSVATGATTRLVGLAASRASGGDGGTATIPRPDSGWARPHEPTPSGNVPAAPRPALAEPPPPSPESEPVHVSEEPTLVEELAEPGAEDGAGAEVHIAEPWDGYARMNAKEVVARLSGSDPAQLAAVQLYEGSHRQRQTILNAVQRELRSTNGRSG